MILPAAASGIAPSQGNLDDIRYGEKPDIYGWNYFI